MLVPHHCYFRHLVRSCLYIWSLSSQLLSDVFQAEQRIEKQRGRLAVSPPFSPKTKEWAALCWQLTRCTDQTPPSQKKTSSNWKLSTLAASKNPFEKYTFFSYIKKYLYYYAVLFRWTGSTHSQMFFLYFTCVWVCEHVSLLCECMFACVSVCPKEQACVRLYSLIISFS